MSRFTKVLIVSALILIPLAFVLNMEAFSSIFSEDTLTQLLDSGNLGLALLITFAAGFATSLSPCIYPVIPITLSVIGARRYESPVQGFLVSLAYVSGMVSLYVALGILFSSVGILFGSVYRSPIVLFCVAALFLFFALSMAGVLNWLLPDTTLTRLSKLGGSGMKGAFLMGLVSGLIASPCTGPILAFILTLISAQGDLITGSVFMVTYGLGMGVPFLVLGTFSSALARLPKSGAWMNVVKSMFAVTMVAASAYFFVLGISAYTTPPAKPNSDFVASLENDLLESSRKRIPVVVDFHADWCTVCKDIEETVFKDSQVAAKMEEFKHIRVDLSNWNDEIEAKFRIVSLPLILFYDRSGKAVDGQKVTGIISAEAFLQRLDHVQRRSPG